MVVAARSKANTEQPADPFACWGVYSKACATRRALARIADKWTVLIVGRLSSGPRRFGELRRLVEGISSKVLTAVLRELEADGLVSRTVLPTRPPSVEYALTELGLSFVETAKALRDWAERHAVDMEKARPRH